MNFLSIDVETGGLTTEHSLMEIGLVWAHLNQPSEDWWDRAHSPRIVLMHDNLSINTYCAVMHQRLLMEMQEVAEQDWWVQTMKDGYAFARVNSDQPEALSEHTTYYVAADLVPQAFKHALDHFVVPWREEPITVAGKNVGGFDLPFLAANKCLDASPDDIDLDGPPDPPVRIRRRVLDPAILYYEPGDEQLPSLTQCLLRAGLREQVLHWALDDAMQVVKLLRKKLAPDLTQDLS